MYKVSKHGKSKFKTNKFQENHKFSRTMERNNNGQSVKNFYDASNIPSTIKTHLDF